MFKFLPTEYSENMTSVTADEQKEIAARKRRMMFYAAAAGLTLALLVSYAWGWTPGGSCKPESQKGKLDNGQPDIFFNKKTQEISGPRPKDPPLSEAELLKLATDAKNAGLIVQGVTQCGYTRKQRDLFGGPGSEARKVFESMYIECRSRDMCPNVRGYPTWSRGELQFPGFRNADRIRELIKEVGPLPAQQQPQDSSLPNEENLPDAKAAVPAAPLPQDIKAADNVDQAETNLLKPMAAGDESSSDEEEGDGKVENVRGVSQYAPLNVPDMPGTAPMTTGGVSQADYQFIQGNLPRQALDNPEPVAALARQMAATFQQIAHDAARDPGASSFAQAKLPQSANITTGHPMADNRIYTEKN